MKRTVMILAVGLLVAFSVIPAAPPKGSGGRNQPTITFLVKGVQTVNVSSGTQFDIRGTNFNDWSPVWVCIVYLNCEEATVDSSGSFVQSRTLTPPYPYTYTVDVYQWSNKTARTTKVVASGQITIGN